MINDVLKMYMNAEEQRQEAFLQMIASENFASDAVRELTGSVFTNKYAEGYPGQRYYNGCEIYDDVESYAKVMLKEVYRCEYSNVQPHSGANANLAAMTALLNHGDKVLAMRLDHGGHLSHGAPVNISGSLYEFYHYGVNDSGFLDYDQIESQATQVKPKMIIAGASAYPRRIDWEKFREIADKVGALLLVDMAHYSGLIAGGAYPSPIPHADVVTSTTHKTLRGPRGGMILWNDNTFTKKINSAVFPGTQGGPLMNHVAAKAQCFYEASKEPFHLYSKAVVENARAMCDVFRERGIPLITNGTDSHMILVDLSSRDIYGSDLADRLEMNLKIVVNKNGIPNDPNPPKYTSGIRIGTAAETTRGRTEQEFRNIATDISNTIDIMTREI